MANYVEKQRFRFAAYFGPGLAVPNSVVSGTAALLVARLMPPAASFGVFYLAVLHWGPDTWGLFHVLLSVQAVLQMAAGLGVDLLLLQKVSARPEKLPALLRAVSRLLFRVGLVLGAAMILVAWFLSPEAEARWAAVFFGTALPASSLSATLEASWVSLGNARRVAVVVILEHGMRLLLSVAALAIGGGPAALALVLFVSKWLGTTLLLLPLWKVGRPAEPITLSALIRQASPFALFFAASAFLHRMDSLAVAAFRPLVDVGYYGAATRLVLLPTIVSQAFGIALYPHLVRARAVPERFNRLARTALLTLCAASFVPAGVLIAFPEPILRLLGMEDYLPAGSLLALLALALPALFSTEVAFRSLLAQERLGACLRVAGLQVGLGALTLIVATNLYGVRGAAVATVGIAWLGTVGYLFSLYNNRPGGKDAPTLSILNTPSISVFVLFFSYQGV